MNRRTVLAGTAAAIASPFLAAVPALADARRQSLVDQSLRSASKVLSGKDYPDALRNMGKARGVIIKGSTNTAVRALTGGIVEVNDALLSSQRYGAVVSVGGRITLTDVVSESQVGTESLDPTDPPAVLELTDVIVRGTPDDGVTPSDNSQVTATRLLVEAVNQLLTDLPGLDGGFSAAREQREQVVGAGRLHVAVRLDRLHAEA